MKQIDELQEKEDDSEDKMLGLRADAEDQIAQLQANKL
jgi:hypothetical protein